MLLRQEVADGVEVLAVQGPVGERDAHLLEEAVRRALALEPRGVVLDLTRVTDVAAEALQTLLRTGSPGWPRPSLAVCGAPSLVTAALSGAVPTYGDRAEALRHVDDRSAAPRERIDVPDGPGGPAAARSAAREFARRLGLHRVADDVALVVSELVTNALRHAGQPVTLEVGLDAQSGTLTVAVADGAPGRPAARSAEPDAEGGRGLLLVDLLAAECGVRPDPPGKTVWAALQVGGARPAAVPGSVPCPASPPA